MTKAELARKIFEVAHLTGEFKLRSGQTSQHYFDKYRFEADPQLLKAVGRFAKELVPTDCELLAGLEMGGIPIAVALAFETGLPVVFVRKEAKSYGTCQFAEGAEIKGRKLLVVEDVVTTGGQLVLSTKDLRNSGAVVEHALCVIDRSEGKTEKIVEAGLQLRALFTSAELFSATK